MEYYSFKRQPHSGQTHVGNFPTNCLSMFDHFVELALNRSYFESGIGFHLEACQLAFYYFPRKFWSFTLIKTLKFHFRMMNLVKNKFYWLSL